MSPRSLRIHVTEDAERLPRAWDRLAGARSVLLSRQYLQTLLRRPPTGTAYRCAWACDGDALVAVALFHVIPLDLSHFAHTLSRLPSAIRAALGRLAAQQRHAPVLVFCGNVLHADAPGFACLPDLPAASVLHDLAEAARSTGETPSRLVVVKEADLPQADHIERLAAEGYASLDILQPSMEVHLSPGWASWNDYLAALHKKYRQRARAARARAAGQLRTRHEGTSWLHHAPFMAGLLAPVLARAELSLVPVTTETLRTLAEGLGDRLVVHTYTAEQRLTGFGLSIRDGRVLHAMLLAVEDTANREHKLYQNLLYDFVEEAISQGVDTLALGRTALEMKSTVGAQPRSHGVFLRHASTLQPVLVAAARQVQPAVWTPRHALRSPLAAPAQPTGEGLG